MRGGPASSPRFMVYLGLLTVAAAGALASPLVIGEAFSGSLVPFATFVVLFTVAEYGGTLFNREDGSVSFSAAEAILLAALVAMPAGEVFWIVAIGTVASEIFDRISPVKAVFNSTSAIVAVVAGSSISVLLSDLAPGSTIAVIGAAAVGVIVYSLVTHLFVSGALASAGETSFLSTVGTIPRAFLLNLAGSLLVGVIFSAAYLGTPWSAAVFPLALIALSLGYRAVLQQAQERERIESLHEASRALAAAPNLTDAIPGFLRSVAGTVSALGAQTLLRDGDVVVGTKTYAGDLLQAHQPISDPALLDLLARLDASPAPIVVDYDIPDEMVALTGALAARDLVAVPLMESDSVVGCLIVHNHVGSESFGDRDVRLLGALGNELAATMASHRLFDEVAEEKERFQLLVESVHDYAIFMLDPGGHVVSWNAGAERIQGYQASEVVGRHFTRFYPPGDDDRWREELSIAAEEGRLEIEGWRLRKDGTRFLANEVVTPVRDAEGALRGFAKVTRDITERVQAEQEKESLEAQLHQVQKLESVGQLAGGIAHDFNNILAVISNCSSFVLDALSKMPLEDDDREIVQDVEEIRTASERARSLTRQLLVFSRRDAAEPRVLDINEVIANMTKLMRRAVGESVTIRTELDAATGSVFADQGQLEQVLLNLAINARDAMAGSGSLVISTSEVTLDAAGARRYVDLTEGSYVRIEVIDTGSGMPPDVIEKAFDPFFTTKPKGQGTGLGLATVYGIVRRAGGHIGIRSRPGLGTTFTIHLPVTSISVDAATDDPKLDVPRGRGERILLVEDEGSVRAVAKRLLTQGGYEVVEADSGNAALKLMNEESGRVDILVSDVVMPGISGIELGHTLQSMNPRLPAVYLTGYSEAAAYASELGEKSMLLHKPFDRTELLTAIHDLLHPEKVKTIST